MFILHLVMNIKKSKNVIKEMHFVNILFCILNINTFLQYLYYFLLHFIFDY